MAPSVPHVQLQTRLLYFHLTTSLTLGITSPQKNFHGPRCYFIAKLAKIHGSCYRCSIAVIINLGGFESVKVEKNISLSSDCQEKSFPQKKMRVIYRAFQPDGVRGEMIRLLG